AGHLRSGAQGAAAIGTAECNHLERILSREAHVVEAGDNIIQSRLPFRKEKARKLTKSRAIIDC
ncbi:MAG: hypothetical protein WCL32_20870, partial [Planctomycetota bacterium]